MIDKKKIGDKGEKIACDFLIRQGFEILQTNFHSRYGEIDIICKKEDLLVFAEVKTRKNDKFARACEFVDYKKQKKMTITAEYYIMQNNIDMNIRFDVLEIYTDNAIKINHIINAFEAVQYENF